MEKMKTETTSASYWAGHNDAMELAALFSEKMHSEGPLGKFPGEFVATQLRGMKAILDKNGDKLMSDFAGQDLNHADRTSGP